MDRKIPTIVVGVAEMQPEDPRVAPPGEDPVLAPAAALAEGLGARLYVVHALNRPRSVCDAPSTEPGSARRDEQHRELAEKRLCEQSRRFPNASRICCRCVSGDAALQLCAFAEEVAADLIIVGATRRDGMWHNYLGTTVERVLHRSPIPVLVVRHFFRNAVRRVLLTTDMSEFSPALHEAALDTVDSLLGAEPYEPRTLLVCWYNTSTAACVSQEFMNAAATRRLHEFLTERQRRTHPVAGRVRIGNPSTEILREASEWKADLLVLGTHGRWTGAAAHLGSTVSAVLRGSSCNALVIPVSHRVPRHRDVQGHSSNAEGCFPGTEEHPENGVVFVSGGGSGTAKGGSARARMQR
jgi:nucleotide-binding universal stress UspA family protein